MEIRRGRQGVCSFLGRRREDVLGGFGTTQDPLDLGGAHRHVADARQRNTSVGDLPILEANDRCRADHGEVAVAPGDLLDCAAGAWSCTPYPDRGQDLVGLEGGREESAEEVGRLDDA